ncbi:hypothetical protein FHS83_001996 [Rhizomicrobium palustre]|uniref:Uncharacterized protein n=1 Tax=Rhizomicrobium palustre TaxID=189966 RepID=A0A846MYH7_9PROT|nr:hypothetical protein [Rhizomicrobium palustre]NIK88678.1 hypothetical protein [Rhizomicrobium palustre]
MTNARTTKAHENVHVAVMTLLGLSPVMLVSAIMLMQMLGLAAF